MNKPIIGIVAKNVVESDIWHYMGIVDNIRYVLIKNNALAVGLLPTEEKINFKLDEEIDTHTLSLQEKKDLEAIIDKLDGVILEGGLISNAYEEEIARICINKDKHLLGICSGFNNMVRTLNGQVHIDVNIFHKQFGAKIAHEVYINKDSKLFEILRQEKINVNSIHTCIAKKEEIKGYKIVATCPIDGNVEAIELENKKFIIGIKWHPELMDSMNCIFEEFIKACNL